MVSWLQPAAQAPKGCTPTNNSIGRTNWDSIAFHRQQAGIHDDWDAEDNDYAAQRDQSD